MTRLSSSIGRHHLEAETCIGGDSVVVLCLFASGVRVSIRLAVALVAACIATSSASAPRHPGKPHHVRTDLPSPCDMKNLGSCPDTNHLVWTPAFTRAVHSFLGRRPATYLGLDYPIADEFINVMSGPPDPPERIGELFRFTACEAHACPDKAAAVLTSDGQLVAVARLGSRCTIQEFDKESGCLSDIKLTIFMRSQEQQQAIIDNLSQWAKQELSQEYHLPGSPPARLVGVDVVPVRPRPGHTK